MRIGKKDGGVDAPVSLCGLFGTDESDDDSQFEQVFAVQEGLKIGDVTLNIRQTAWHMANANKVWPGTFSLASFIMDNCDHYGTGRILELGAATGALAIFLVNPPRNYSVVTSDIDDGGEVAANIEHNFTLNGNIL